MKIALGTKYLVRKQLKGASQSLFYEVHSGNIACWTSNIKEAYDFGSKERAGNFLTTYPLGEEDRVIEVLEIMNDANDDYFLPNEISLRDRFAMAALPGLGILVGGRKDFNSHEIAVWAYDLADAMMEVRNDNRKNDM